MSHQSEIFHTLLYSRQEYTTKMPEANMILVWLMTIFLLISVTKLASIDPLLLLEHWIMYSQICKWLNKLTLN